MRKQVKYYSIGLPEEIRQEVDVLARRWEITMGAMVRYIIKDWLRMYKAHLEEEGKSCTLSDTIRDYEIRVSQSLTPRGKRSLIVRR
jgi:hypothetical protein